MERGIQKFSYVASVAAVAGGILWTEWTRVGPNTWLEALYLTLLGLAVIPLSILIVSTILYVNVRPRPFPRMAVQTWPRVAVLYVAYNDVMPRAIRLTLAQVDYPSAEVWLLSDSSRPETVAEEESLAGPVRIFRRPLRRGGKAGAINDWLRAHGAEVTYVVPMDADAILAPGSLRALVEIAEHPANRRYAGFQTLMEVHPAVAASPFARNLGRAVKWGCRILPLTNQRLFGQGMYWGSNALLRVATISAAGGWVEDSICEDFALTARLDAAGQPIALVDLYNYEGFPLDALSLRERTVRWCRANLSVVRSVFRAKTGFAVRLSVAIPILFYLMAPVLLGLVLVNIVTPPDARLHRLSTLLGALLLGFVFLHRLVAVPRSRQSLREYGATLVAETLVVLGMSLRVAWCFVVACFRRPAWVPSRKEARALSPSQAIRASIPEIGFGLFLLIALAYFRAPWEAVALSSLWVVSFLATPAVLWLSSRVNDSAGGPRTGSAPRGRAHLEHP